MSGKRIYIPKQPHKCGVPAFTDDITGTRWQCDECHTVWRAKLLYEHRTAYWVIENRFRRWIREWRQK